jgi:hypothetical protein
MNGVAADKKPERRSLGRVPTRDSLKHVTAAAAPEKLATWMGGLSVFGVLFCLLLEMIDVSAEVELTSFKISANVGLVGFVCGAVIYTKALFKPTPRRRRLSQEPVTLPAATWVDAEDQRR